MPKATLKEHIIKVLVDNNGAPLHVNEITRRVLENGWKTSAQKPEDSVSSTLNVDLKGYNLPDGRKITKSDKATFGLSKNSRSVADKKMTLKDHIIKVLVESKGKPMGVKEIAKKAHDNGWTTTSNTPTQSIWSTLSTKLRDHVIQDGRKITKFEKGFYGLTKNGKIDSKKVSLKDHIIKVLVDNNGAPLHVNEITKKAQENGWKTTAQKPEDSVSSTLNTYLNGHVLPDGREITKFDKATFGLSKNSRSVADKKMTLKDHIIKVLMDNNGAPLHVNEITKRVLENGWKTSAQKPEDSVSSTLNTYLIGHILPDGRDISKSNKAIFGLSNNVKSDIKKKITLKDQIIRVLKENQGKPMSTKEITKLVQKYGWKTSAKKPEDSVRAELNVRLKKHVIPDGRMVTKFDKGLFGLSKKINIRDINGENQKNEVAKHANKKNSKKISKTNSSKDVKVTDTVKQNGKEVYDSKVVFDVFSYDISSESDDLGIELTLNEYTIQLDKKIAKKHMLSFNGPDARKDYLDFLKKCKFDDLEIVELENPKLICVKVPVKEVLFNKQNGECNGCHIKFPIKNFTIDHKTPVSKGGSDEFENLHLLCNFCNSSKGDKTMVEWKGE